MKYFLIAGEASGDLHASRVMKNLLRLDVKAEFRFFGGDKMSRYGGSPIMHYRDMAYMGFKNVLTHLDKIAEIRRRAEHEIASFQPDHLILVDYSGFNLRFAGYVKKNMPSVEIHYYIAPKLWAWKEWRMKSIIKYVDRMYTIFPFETEWFGKRGFSVEYVGNPSVDSVASFRKRGFDRELFKRANGLDDKPIIALLAGSRMQEIKDCLSRIVGCVGAFPDYQFVLAAAPSIDLSKYRELLGEDSQLKIVQNATYELLEIATAAVVTSGTATLETALFRVPQVVVYDVFSSFLGSIVKPIFIKTKFVSLVNIIAQKEVVRELICMDFTTENVVKELRKALGEKRVEIIEGYDKVIDILGPEGTGERVARKIFNSK